MSSNTYTRPLYTVPNVPPNTKARFAALLAIRDAAHRALDKALSVPRSAIRWAVTMFERWADATASVGVYSWLREQAANAASMIRAVGVVPLAVAVLSTPPMATAAARVGRSLGNGLRRVATSAWKGLRDLLARCGSTGSRIAEGLAHAGANVAEAVRTAIQHPIMEPIVQALRDTLALMRPISQGFVAHRLLGAMVPILWLRTLIGFLVIPLLIDTNSAGGFRDFANAQWTTTSDPRSNGNRNRSDSTRDGLLIDAFGPATEAPMPTNGTLPTDDATTDEDSVLNRAERRAQQREDARARRSQPRR